MQFLLDFFLEHHLEIIGTITGLLYIFLSVNQSIWLWPVGIVTSAFQLIVFFQSRIYADMSLQGYYVLVSFYGWYIWKFVKNKDEKKRPVITLGIKDWAYFSLATGVIFIALMLALIRFTDSDVPRIDAFTSALSITGTFLLARKYLENWCVWIVVDTVSAGLYIYKGLFFFAFLYFFLAIISFVGLKKWRKDICTT
jgi:nicotinamide mononucleotide transporter